MLSHRLRGVGLIGALAVGSLGSVAFVATGAARTTTPRPIVSPHSTAPKPTVVLVHGAFADSSGWDGAINRLRRDGYPVVAAPNPLLGLAFDADTVRGFLDSIPGPKILVGHSYGGDVITQAASGDPDVKALVYIAALAPARGESIEKLFMRHVAHPVPPLPLVPVKVSQPDGTTRTDLYLNPSQFRARFAADLPPAVVADLIATQRPLSAAAFTDKVTVTPAWKTIPSWYLVSNQDMGMSPDLERFMAHRIHAHTSAINASHAGYISHPAAVVRLIEQAASATS
jgi:pimeloyl-ACP methyl ester carboxylesterase